MRRRSFYFLAVCMFCFGVLLPGFVLFGWTRNSRDVAGLLGDGFLNPLSGSQSESLTGARNNSNSNEDRDIDMGGQLQVQRLEKPMDKVIIFGETESGRDSTPLSPNSDSNITASAQRDFIRKVGPF